MNDLKSRITALVEALAEYPNAMSLQRRIRACRSEILFVLETGYPVKLLAADLDRAGIRTIRSRPISVAHLRALIGRSEPSEKSASTATKQHSPAISSLSSVDNTERLSSNQHRALDSKSRPDFSGGLFKKSEIPSK